METHLGEELDQGHHLVSCTGVFVHLGRDGVIALTQAGGERHSIGTASAVHSPDSSPLDWTGDHSLSVELSVPVHQEGNQPISELTGPGSQQLVHRPAVQHQEVQVGRLPQDTEVPRLGAEPVDPLGRGGGGGLLLTV